MKRPFPLVLACLLCFSAAVRAQTPPTPPTPAPAHIHLICAYNAKVTIDGQDTHTVGIFRKFETAPFNGTGKSKIDVCNGTACNTYTVTLTAGQTTLLTAIQSLKEVEGARVGGFLGDTPCGSGGCSNCTTGCPAGCPGGQCYGQQATYGSFPQMFQGFQGGCANGQCGGTSRGFRGR